MATAIVMPKQGQSVESCLISGWKKEVGDQIAAGEVLCEVETDKALLEVESPAAGVLLARFFEEGDEVPVLTNIAALGEVGENIDALYPQNATVGGQSEAPASLESQVEPTSSGASNGAKVVDARSATPVAGEMKPSAGVSPRARNLAQQKGIELTGLQGTGPGGRIIERDVQAFAESQPRMTPLAKSMVTQGDYQAPPQGSGVSGRIRSEDLLVAAETEAEGREPMPTVITPAVDEIELIPLKGVRKVIATRMLESLQTTAQLTLNATAEARALLDYRQRLKASAEELGLQRITINDLILFAASRVLPQHLGLNAHFDGETMTQYKTIHLGVAVDTPRGLMVPVVKNANRLSLKQIAQESKRLATLCQTGKITPDELSGGTFTVTNLGSFGVESFTPILNAPEVGILGVGNINLKPVQMGGTVEFVPHLGLSLTINHQVVDGAPAARFLQALSQGVAEIEMLLAV